MILLFGLLPDPAQAQSVKSSDISIDLKNEQIKDVFKQITKSSNYKFFMMKALQKMLRKSLLNFPTQV
ncbi:hypothetical protein FACS189413_18310 [Bacteroidia bacterium]|nr:hypothetical protein FACS189413_18310 [Bacteroidia bacterium]